MKKYLILLPLVIALIGCGNAAMKAINPAGGTMTLYAASGKVIKTYQTDGEPVMHPGGHLYCREKGTNRFIVIYGTYTFEENQ